VAGFGGGIREYFAGLRPSPPDPVFAQNLDLVAAETEHLSLIYERKFAVLEALKKSLLCNAFSGHL
jgi:hypothetical protein